MKTGYWLSIACGFVFFASITCAQQKVLSFAASEGYRRQPVAPNSIELLPPANPRRPTELERAYVDAFSILNYENSCSEFYGGSSALVALNELAQQIRPAHLDSRIGIRMTGETTIVTSMATGFTFRLFARAEVNLDGPFYQPRSSSSRGTLSQIGPFEPNTREARVTTVLHELGHLIRKPDGKWVLPNDGDNFRDSEENTRRVLDVCGEQIRVLHNFSFEEEILGARAGSNALDAFGG
jgi:hypothetical protein